MHELVSMSLATTGALRMPGAGVELADIARISSTFPATARLLCLLQLYKEALVLWREGVWIYHAVRHEVRDGALLLAGAEEAPMDRHAYLVDLLSGDRHGLDALRDHCLSHDGTAGGGDAHVLRALDALLGGEFFRDLDKEFRLALEVVLIVLRPVVEVLGEPVGGRDDGILVGFAEAIPLRLEGLGGRVRVLPLGMERVLHRRLHGFVVLSPRAIGELTGHEETRHAFGVHDERSHASFRRRVGLVIGNVSDPLVAIPLCGGTRGIPRFAGCVGRAAVVHDATIGGPVKGPLGVAPQTAGVGAIATLREVPGLGVGADVEPVAAHGGAVGAGVEELSELIASLEGDDLRVLLVHNVGERPAVDLFRDLFERRLGWTGVPPVEGLDGIRILAAFLLVQFANLEEDAGNDLLIRLCLPGWIDGFVLPGNPTGGVGEGSVLFGEVGAGKRKTSVWTSCGLPSFSQRTSGFQKEAVSVSKFSATTSHLSLLRAAMALRECGPLQTGFMPKLNRPSI